MNVNKSSLFWGILLIGGGALILTIVGMNLIWRNRLRGVREEIVRRSRI